MISSQSEYESTKESVEQKKKGFCEKLLSLPCLSNAKLRMRGEKRAGMSRDFWTSLVPGQRDHGTFKFSRSCPVLSRDLEPLVLGLPGMSRDLFGRLCEKKNSIQRYLFFFLAKLLLFDCEL